MAKNDKLKIARNLICITLGCMIIGFAYNAFCVKSNITIAGLSGLCMIFTDILEMIFHFKIPFTILYALINIVLLIFSYKRIGKTFALYTIYGILCYTIFIESGVFFQNLDIPSTDLLLCAIYAGILIGFGLGVVFRSGGSTGGSDIIAFLINKKHKNINVGTITIVINSLVVLSSIFMYGMSLSLYVLINIVLAGVIANIVMDGSLGVQSYYVVSEKSNLISQEIMDKLKISVTSFYARSDRNKTELEVLCCVLHKYDVNSLKEIIYEIDTNAFVYATKISEAMNKGFSRLSGSNDIITKIDKHQQKIKLKKQNKNLKKDSDNIENI